LTPNIYWRRADGAREEQRLTDSPNAQFAESWHPSGKLLAFHEINPKTASDLMLLPIEGDESSGWKPGTPRAWLATPASEGNAAFSPDGRWLAYAANDSGPSEVYVRPFPGPGGRVQVSTGGGSFPIWSRAKRELFYQSLDRRIMAVGYATKGESFVADKPRRWSEQQVFSRGAARGFDVHPDGERVAFAPAQDGSAAKQDKVVFVFNFFDQLRALAPVRKP
jgi:dipeptidyl aminopeptidase/acylaminoacyl peptidase